MKIVVCIKQVVDTDDIKWTVNNTIDRNGVQSIVNPCDMLAIETAIKIKEKNPQETSITVISMGPKQAIEALKTAIAMGCDDAVLLCDKKFSGADTVATSRTLASGIKKCCPDFDLIICGQYALDGDTAQTGPSIAQKLGVEQVTYVSEIAEIGNSEISALRLSDDAVELIQVQYPALICMADCPYEPRAILIDGYIKAQDFDVKVFNLSDLELSADNVGIKGSPTWVSKAFRAESNRNKEVVECSSDEAVCKLSEFVNFVNDSAENLFRNEAVINSPVLKNSIVNFEKKILVWGEVDKNNDLKDVVFQLVSKAKELSNSIDNSGVTVISALSTIETQLPKLSQCGADEVVLLDSDVLKTYNTKNYADAILQYLKAYPAEIFLIGATKQGRDLAPQISSALETGLTADCTGLEITDDKKLAATRPTFGGELMATILCKTLPQMATVRPGVFPVKNIESCEFATVVLNRFEPQFSTLSSKKILKSFDINKDNLGLESAEIVFAGGRGLKDKATFEALEKLAQLLNVQVGATRKAVDAGLAEQSVQIGQTGKTIAPKLYIAFGISGAVQHCVGVSSAGKIIAVNSDKTAPITKFADLTIVADAKQVINEWIDILQK